jgi:hypothetical protein
MLGTSLWFDGTDFNPGSALLFKSAEPTRLLLGSSHPILLWQWLE